MKLVKTNLCLTVKCKCGSTRITHLTTVERANLWKNAVTIADKILISAYCLQ